MLLVVDIGNTQSTLGLYQNEVLVHKWRMASDKTDTADELHERLYGYFCMFGLDLSQLTEAAVASVVPRLTQEWRHMLLHILDEGDILIVSTKRHCGIEIAMDENVQVGADRIANALAAKVSYGPSTIVVDFGTATNIDVVDARGRFRGGAIMPGLMSSANSLFANAARLASVDLVCPKHALGTNTEEALQSGIIIGTAAQAEGLVRRIKAELIEPKATVVATGGFATEIAKATDIFDTVDSDLTIRGIYYIWKHRADKRSNN